MPIIKDADNRYDEISKVLDIDNNSVKAKEKNLKINYWIHNSQIIVDSGLYTEREKCRSKGAATASGVSYVIYDSSWKDHVRKLVHEEAHRIWYCEVGEAPSILNEGVAVYVETF